MNKHLAKAKVGGFNINTQVVMIYVKDPLQFAIMPRK